LTRFPTLGLESEKDLIIGKFRASFFAALSSHAIFSIGKSPLSLSWDDIEIEFIYIGNIRILMVQTSVSYDPKS